MSPDGAGASGEERLRLILSLFSYEAIPENRPDGLTKPIDQRAVPLLMA
jgi:hypothetical protein